MLGKNAVKKPTVWNFLNISFLFSYVRFYILDFKFFIDVDTFHKDLVDFKSLFESWRLCIKWLDLQAIDQCWKLVTKDDHKVDVTHGTPFYKKVCHTSISYLFMTSLRFIRKFCSTVFKPVLGRSWNIGRSNASPYKNLAFHPSDRIKWLTESYPNL